MSSQGGREGQKLPISKENGGGGQKLPNLRWHSLWTTPKYLNAPLCRIKMILDQSILFLDWTQLFGLVSKSKTCSEITCFGPKRFGSIQKFRPVQKHFGHTEGPCASILKSNFWTFFSLLLNTLFALNI